MRALLMGLAVGLLPVVGVGEALAQVTGGFRPIPVAGGQTRTRPVSIPRRVVSTAAVGGGRFFFSGRPYVYYGGYGLYFGNPWRRWPFPIDGAYDPSLVIRSTAGTRPPAVRIDLQGGTGSDLVPGRASPLSLARLAVGGRHYSGAIERYGELLAQQPGWPRVSAELAVALALDGRISEGAAVFRGAIEVQPALIGEDASDWFSLAGRDLMRASRQAERASRSGGGTSALLLGAFLANALGEDGGALLDRALRDGRLTPGSLDPRVAALFGAQ
ncbi:MAG: hypothetical protein AAFR38_02500 [Planctomycetota bacterium]